ncbi:MAG: PEP-CTERM sorting domain-containing protein [Candidatus Thiodiazotropha sp. (ex Lucinoma borealis)]|nr:PEP-CTERM sorting domain-containing protein [Candidatus Thiodiazotropha sp. (ex Lucinoma borealis)]
MMRPVFRAIFKAKLPIALSVLFISSAEAVLLFDDGNVHTLRGAVFDNVLLENGSDLIIENGLVLPSSDDPAVTANSNSVMLRQYAAAIGGIRSDYGEVSLMGNTLVIGTGEESSTTTPFGRAGVGGANQVTVDGRALIAGASHTTHGGMGIANYSSGGQQVTLNSGYVFGGSSAELGGSGIGLIGFGESLDLSVNGGSVIGGNGGVQGGNGIGREAQISEDMSGQISGGYIAGGYGGERGGHALSSSLSSNHLNVTGGMFLGGNGGQIGGNALNLTFYSDDSVDVAISGGVFDAGFGDLDDGWLMDLSGFASPLNPNHNVEIAGGLFGSNNSGRGINIANGGVVDVYGNDLSFTDGLLSGYLSDGHWIETLVSLGTDSSAGTLNLHNSSGYAARTGLVDSETTPLMPFVEGRYVAGPDPVAERLAEASGFFGIDNLVASRYEEHVGRYEPSSVPEPSTLLLFSIGILGLGMFQMKAPRKGSKST